MHNLLEGLKRAVVREDNPTERLPVDRTVRGDHGAAEGTFYRAPLLLQNGMADRVYVDLLKAAGTKDGGELALTAADLAGDSNDARQ